MNKWLSRDDDFNTILHKYEGLDDEAVIVRLTKLELVNHLKSNKIWSDLPSYTFTGLKTAKTFFQFNEALGEVYNYADIHRIWLTIPVIIKQT